ncbi:MAG: NADH-quinone oxidoreductase subunit J [Anaerolineae bacterium]|nr:NADH-quinone oxidoreductase subunit J [Anaerolineae bacterium]
MLTSQQIGFLILGAMTLGAAILVVRVHQVFHATLSMILSFLGVAGLYVLLGVSFMAGLQLFIYIGGVSVLTVVALMVTRGGMDGQVRIANESVGAAIITLAMFAGLTWLILQVPWPITPLVPAPADDVVFLGETLVAIDAYAIPFELASLLLFVVLIGALYIARER